MSVLFTIGSLILVSTAYTSLELVVAKITIFSGAYLGWTWGGGAV